jgi:hypothetical protein
MVISSNENGEINADAIDLDTGAGGEHHVLSVSLKSLDEASRVIELPDFELENNEEPPSGLYNKASKIEPKEKKPFPWAVVIIIGIILILALAGIWLFLFGGKEKVASFFDNPPAESSVTQPVPEQFQKPLPPPPPPVEIPPYIPPPVITAPESPPVARADAPARTRPPAPVASYRVPANIPPEGVPYTIRWGDTLWDISEAFYRNPWLYPRIARFNNIRNPDLIISGRTIRIPPRQ